MDRNDDLKVPDGISKVALRKESVDRNIRDLLPCGDVFKSLSARRAWIEIICADHHKRRLRSLSARRAWIEIMEMRKFIVEIHRRSPQGERG